MEGGKAPCRRFADLEEVAEVGAGVVGARRAITCGIDGAEVIRVNLVEEILRLVEVVTGTRPLRGKAVAPRVETATSGVTGGQGAIEDGVAEGVGANDVIWAADAEGV
jgi:hypothetical protein